MLSGVVQKAVHELREAGGQVLLLTRVVARLDVDYSSPLAQSQNLLVVRLVVSRVDVYVDPSTGQLLSDLADVDVHSTSVLAPQPGYWTAVDADYCNPFH